MIDISKQALELIILARDFEYARNKDGMNQDVISFSEARFHVGDELFNEIVRLSTEKVTATYQDGTTHCEVLVGGAIFAMCHLSQKSTRDGKE